MKKYILTLLLTVVASNSFSKDIHVFNTKVLGSKTNEPIFLINKQNQDGIEPISITVDTKNGHYIAATVIYPHEAIVSEVKAILNQHYQKYELDFTRKYPAKGLWRNEDEKYSIQLTTDDEGNILVIYVRFKDSTN